MATFRSTRALASLFDTASYLEPAIPLELLVAWSASDQTEEAARALLAEFAVEGTCMLGDASGLSKLSRELPLVDVLALLHRPKSMVMTAALDAGGEAVNGWTADNTAVWFPRETAPGEVFACAERLVTSFERLPFQMSFGMHYGTFYKVGNTLLGPAFQSLEHIAENEVPAGKIWASDAFCRALNREGNLAHDGRLRMHELPCAQTEGLGFQECFGAYPHGFDQGFYALLDRFARAGEVEARVLRETLEQHAGRTGYVLFFAYRLGQQAGLAGVLGQQLEDTMLRSRFAEIVLPEGTHWVKAGGGIGIVLGDTLQSLLELSKLIARVCREESVEAAFGIDKGSYFYFQQEDGGRDVAGSPVNIASKLSEDAGEAGAILISEAAWQGGEAARRTIEVSGIALTAMHVDLATL